MTNIEILNTAMRQSAIDSNCSLEDFKARENKMVISATNTNARKYLRLPFDCDLTSYGSNIVASVSEDLRSTIEEYINRFEMSHCFETPNIYVLNEKLKSFGKKVCFMAEYFLPDMTILSTLECDYETKVLQQFDFADLYLPKWQNALCEDRKHLDILGVGAYENGKLIGLAACSADCKTMWQIGIDVLPEYRNCGIAASLTNKLAREILARDIVPFYCCAWSNIKSVKTALKSGFRPAWVQMTVKDNSFINKINED